MDDNQAERAHDATISDTTENWVKDRRRSSKALKTLGVDVSARKKRQILGIDEDQLNIATKEATEPVGAQVGGHSREIPPEQIEAQRKARGRRSRSYSPSAHASSSNHFDTTLEETNSLPEDTVSLPEESSSSRHWRTRDDSDPNDLDLTSNEEFNYRHRGARGSHEAHSDDEIVISSAPNPYFYYYFDGTSKVARRRKFNFDSEQTPMIDKKANKKALAVLGVDPSAEKVLDILGIDDPHILETAINESLSTPAAQCIPSSKTQPKALNTLGFSTVPNKADHLLGRYLPPGDSLFDLQLQCSISLGAAI